MPATCDNHVTRRRAGTAAGAAASRTHDRYTARGATIHWSLIITAELHVKWIGAVPAAGLTLLMATSGNAASRDIDGRPLAPFDADGHTQIVFFVATDCPISSAYAPEIQRVCKAYDAKGVRCTLSYEDEHVDAAARALSGQGVQGISDAA
jgi:hypothetical protein